MIDFDLIWNSIPKLLEGTLLTIFIAVISATIGGGLGIILSFLETLPYKILRALILCYITLLRGTPMLVQILFVFYVLPEFGIKIPPFWAASLAIGFNSSAYVSRIIKSGINAVPNGQMEAAQTLGFSRITTMRYIVFPQAFKVALPALGNELVTLIKDSSLASVIGVMELSKEASIIRSRTYDAFSILLAVTVIYLILTGVMSLIIEKIQKVKKC